MYSLPQEIEVWYIIPAIRKELARLLTENHKLSYEKTGDTLGISKAAVSQYLSNKRANKIELSSEIKIEVEKSAKMIFDNPLSAVHEIQRILGIMKTKRDSCLVCKQFNKGVIKYCNSTPSYHKDAIVRVN